MSHIYLQRRFLVVARSQLFFQILDKFRLNVLRLQNLEPYFSEHYLHTNCEFTPNLLDWFWPLNGLFFNLWTGNIIWPSLAGTENSLLTWNLFGQFLAIKTKHVQNFLVNLIMSIEELITTLTIFLRNCLFEYLVIWCVRNHTFCRIWQICHLSKLLLLLFLNQINKSLVFSLKARLVHPLV